MPQVRRAGSARLHSFGAWRKADLLQGPPRPAAPSFQRQGQKDRRLHAAVWGRIGVLFLDTFWNLLCYLLKRKKLYSSLFPIKHCKTYIRYYCESIWSGQRKQAGDVLYYVRTSTHFFFGSTWQLFFRKRNVNPLDLKPAIQNF